jgi:hypothetical protein
MEPRTPDLLQTLRNLSRDSHPIRMILMAHRRGDTTLEEAAAETIVYLSGETARLQAFQDRYVQALRACRGDTDRHRR